MVEIVLEQPFGLFLVGVDEGSGDLLFQQLKIFFVQRILEKLEILFPVSSGMSASLVMLIKASRTLIALMQLPAVLSDSALSRAFMIKRVEMPDMPSRLVASRNS